MKSLRTFVRAAIGVIFPLMALAQSGPQPARPDPADATASVPPLHYESALDTYRPMDDQPTPDKAWRSANDLVRDTGSMSSMRMGDESGDMQNMKGMQMDGMDMKQSKPESSKPAKQKTPSKQDSMPGMDMSTKHDKEMP